jgi:hypothetical protein
MSSPPSSRKSIVLRGRTSPVRRSSTLPVLIGSPSRISDSRSRFHRQRPGQGRRPDPAERRAGRPARRDRPIHAPATPPRTRQRPAAHRRAAHQARPPGRRRAAAAHRPAGSARASATTAAPSRRYSARRSCTIHSHRSTGSLCRLRPRMRRGRGHALASAPTHRSPRRQSTSVVGSWRPGAPPGTDVR